MAVSPDDGPIYIIGPLTVLSCMLLSIASIRVWRRNIGETSCGWRLDYSPDGRTFAIWSVIYLWTFGAVVAQLTGLVHVLDWWTNFFWGVAWVACGLWVPLFDAEYPEALRAAAAMIGAASGWALAGVWHGQLWKADTARQRVEQLAMGLPLTLLCGWLLTATSLGVGIAIKANGVDAYADCVRVSPRRIDESEEAYRYRRRVFYREAYAKAPARVSLVPLVLSVVVGGLAAAVPDPVLCAPLFWAVLNLKAFPSVVYLLSLVVLACGATAASLRVYVW